MNGSNISWGWDAFWLGIGMFVFVTGFIVVSCCRLSSMISQEEEARDAEGHGGINHIKRAA